MSKGTRIEYAIKLFISRAAFQEEESLYSLNKDGQQSGLAQFLPQVLPFNSHAFHCSAAQNISWPHQLGGTLKNVYFWGYRHYA